MINSQSAKAVWVVCKLCWKDYRTVHETKREHLESHGLKWTNGGSDWRGRYFTKPEYAE